MNLSNSFTRNMLLFMAPVSFLLLASCGSYQYSGYESDGIYGDTNEVTYGETDQNATQDSNSSYYKTLFAEEAALYGDVMAEGAIFTDVESYSSTVEYDPNNPQATNYQGGNAPWGQDPDRITINFHNHGFGFYNSFYNPYWGYGYGYNPYWGPYYGPGYWGPWGMGYAGLYPYGYGYGYGFSIHPYFYGRYGYYNPYNFYNHYRHDNYYNNVAYNSGRRNSTSNYSDYRRENLRNAVSLDRGRTSSYSRSIRDLRNSNQDGVTTRRTYSRDYESRVNADSPYRSSRVGDYNRTSRRSDGYINTGNTRTRNSGTVRSSNSTRNSSPSVRSSGSTRSSGTVRSSSGSGRSSGSRGRNN